MTCDMPTAGSPVEVRGGVLHTHSCGDGPPVVLVHGTAPAVWGRLPGLLAAQHRVTTYDRRTFGDASANPPQGPADHADDLIAVLRAQGVKAIVVGWSAGGVIALEAAGRAPGLVSRLVLLEPPLHAKRHPRPSMIAAIAGATIMGRTGRSQAGARRFLRWALHRNDGRSDFDAMPPWWHDRLAGPDGAAVVAELGLGTGEHLGPGFFEQITAPVALLHGDQSRRAFVDAAQRAASLVPDATVAEVHGTGHAIQLQAPEAVVDVVAQEGTNSSNRPRSRKPTEA